MSGRDRETFALLSTIVVAILVVATSQSKRHDRRGHLLNEFTVVTNNPTCTNITRRYAKEKPFVTAPELFIVASVCEGIVHPMDSGLGGGFQMTAYTRHGNRALYVNARERSPSKGHLPASPGQKPWHIGVPGSLAGYRFLYNNLQTFGYRKPAFAWSELFERNRRLAEHGFDISRTLENVLLKIDVNRSPWRVDYDKHKMRAPYLARYLDVIARSGPNGPSIYDPRSRQRDIVANELREFGSSIEHKDLSKYRARRMAPYRVPCLGLLAHSTRVPGSGACLLLGCKILESAIRKQNYLGLSSTNRFVYDVRILHYVYSLQPQLKWLVRYRPRTLRRILLFGSSDLALRIKRSLKRPIPRVAARRFGRNILLPRHQVNGSRTNERGTSNVCVSDKKTTLCATSTINWGFGSGLWSRKYGFFYNNQLADFTFDNPLNLNAPRHDTVPLSSVSTTIFTNPKTGRAVFALGAAGGRKILASLFFAMTELLVQRERGKPLDCERAVSRPRCAFHMIAQQDRLSSLLECENQLNETLKRALLERQALVKYSLEAGYSSVTTIVNGRRSCFDPRRGGSGFVLKIYGKK